ncbi:uncharacterized protein BJ171DRAFT_277201 [Polychytrium aggregatum]|uniref:uncharacterized protein n=1 Tax=Polychytrium aggregatum TaxID=110093 RepID=UPI0022FE5935|nr:uncharacterized protein BJ171DRAFT_277201 [Polychytrium aggregatum]KAI9207533.1 hypothetical protein BJ171DRAFT_277201 [Polychytrium aggregatum]
MLPYSQKPSSQARDPAWPSTHYQTLPNSSSQVPRQLDPAFLSSGYSSQYHTNPHSHTQQQQQQQQQHQQSQQPLPQQHQQHYPPAYQNLSSNYHATTAFQPAHASAVSSSSRSHVAAHVAAPSAGVSVHHSASSLDIPLSTTQFVNSLSLSQSSFELPTFPPAPQLPSPFRASNPSYFAGSKPLSIQTTPEPTTLPSRLWSHGAVVGAHLPTTLSASGAHQHASASHSFASPVGGLTSIASLSHRAPSHDQITYSASPHDDVDQALGFLPNTAANLNSVYFNSSVEHVKKYTSLQEPVRALDSRLRTLVNTTLPQNVCTGYLPSPAPIGTGSTLHDHFDSSYSSLSYDALRSPNSNIQSPCEPHGKALPLSHLPGSTSSFFPDTVGAMDDPAAMRVSDSVKSRRKNGTLEKSASCKKCNKNLAVLVLHGSWPSLEVPHKIDILCLQCDDFVPSPSFSPSESSLVSPTGETTRKRKQIDEAHQPVDCDVCKRNVGRGGVRCIDSGYEHRDEWVKPSFGTEVVCAACSDKYRFCTDCGGGGHWRTGKWRPAEMFSKGRRTCCLNHLRIGDSTVENRFWVTPVASSDAPEILGMVKELFGQIGLSCLGQPRTMERFEPFDTFAKIQHRITYMFEHEITPVLTVPIPNVVTFSGVAFIPSPKPRKHKRNLSRKSWNPDAAVAAVSQIAGAFCIVRWRQMEGTLHLSHRFDRKHEDPHGMMLSLLHEITMMTVKAQTDSEARGDHYPPCKYVWFTRRRQTKLPNDGKPSHSLPREKTFNEHRRDGGGRVGYDDEALNDPYIASYCRLGFKEISEFENDHPDVRQFVFNDEFRSPDIGSQLDLYVMEMALFPAAVKNAYKKDLEKKEKARRREQKERASHATAAHP